MQLWNSEHRYKIEKYYETYLYAVKYVLGFSIEGLRIANQLQNSENDECRETAADYVEMNMNPEVTRDIYHSIVQGIESLSNLRKGFFCIMCDANSQSKLKDYWLSTNIFYNDRIYLSKEFCRGLVDQTIRSSYYTSFYLKRYSENLSKLISCKTGTGKELEYDVGFWTRQQVKNCYYFKDKYFFFYCERYCQKFHLVKPDNIFDGDLGELKKFVDLIMEEKGKAFQDPDNNVLMNGVTYEEDILKYDFEDALKTEIFFIPTMNKVKLHEFSTDALYSGGMDPWNICETSLYEIVIAGASLFKLAVISAFSLILFEA